MDVVVFWNSIPNIILIFILFGYLLIRRQVGAVLVVIFTYISLHNGYVIFASATGDGISTMNDLHYKGSDVWVKLIGSLFLLVCWILLINRLRPAVKYYIYSLTVLAGVAILLLLYVYMLIFGKYGWVGAGLEGRGVEVKEALFSAFMWVAAVIFSVAIGQRDVYWIRYRNEVVLILAAISILMVLAGLYEIESGIVWAGSPYGDGFSYRASGALFNPNVLGFWCALNIIIVSFIFYLRWISKYITFCFIWVLMASLILASSRSGFILSLCGLLCVLILMLMGRKSNNRSLLSIIWPLFSFVGAFFTIAAVIGSLHPSHNNLVKALYANIERILYLPKDIFYIVVIKVYQPLVVLFPVINKFGDPFSGMSMSMTKHLNQSIDGRMLVEQASDNSFVSIYSNGGEGALVMWLCIWGLILSIGVVANKKKPGLISDFALTGFFFCFLSGIFLRSAQLFPVWVFLSMVLGACISWWLPLNNERQNERYYHGENGFPKSIR